MKEGRTGVGSPWVTTHWEPVLPPPKQPHAVPMPPHPQELGRAGIHSGVCFSRGQPQTPFPCMSSLAVLVLMVCVPGVSFRPFGEVSTPNR